jgi:hypothetical protein
MDLGAIKARLRAPVALAMLPFRDDLSLDTQFFLGEEFPGSERPYFFGAAVIKATFEFVGLYGGPVRPPFHELTAAQRAELAGILEALGVPRLAPVPA